MSPNTHVIPLERVHGRKIGTIAKLEDVGTGGRHYTDEYQQRRTFHF